MSQKQLKNRERYYSIKCGIASFMAKATQNQNPKYQNTEQNSGHDGKSQLNQVPQYKSIKQGFMQIYKNEGVAGLYKGVHISALISAFASFCFFALYQHQKLRYEQQGINPMTATSYAGTQAGIFTVIITQPIWVIKTRVLLNTKRKIGQFQNVKQKAIQIWKQQKIKGFSKGLSLNLFLALGGALRVYIYEGAKILFEVFVSKQKQYEGIKHLVSGGLSKFGTTMLSYPFTTVRTRIQQNQFIKGNREAKYKGLYDIAYKIIKQEGLFGFYKGLAPNLIRGVPMRSVYFYSYQLFKSILIDKEVINRKKIMGKDRSYPSLQ